MTSVNPPEIDTPSLFNTQHITDREVQECPWPYYAAMHELDGFYFDEKLNMFVCANYKLMREILRDTKLYSNVHSQDVSQMRAPPKEVINIQKRSQRNMQILVSQDPPGHTRVRKMVDDPFRPREIAKLRPAIQDIVNHTIDQFIHKGQCEVVEQLAVPIPVTVIADVLGLDRKYAGDIKSWSDASVEPLGMMISDERWIECAQIIEGFHNFITQQLELRKQDPKDDFLTHLVSVTDEHGKHLTLGEVLSVTLQILVAGNETTTNGITAALQLLIDNPKQSELLRQEPERMMTFVNEALRLESPVQGLFRVVMEDTTIHNITVPKGSRIMLRYAAANRDPNKYANPDTLDICRKNSGTQVGFGAGIHHCLGASLAREEMIQTFSILLTRLNNIRYIENANSFHHHPSMILRGLSELHIQFDKSG